MNMSRIGKYSEKSFRLHFEQPSDFFAFDKLLTEHCCSGHLIIAGDCSYIPKSGKKTPHIGMFRNGCASEAGRGLEISSSAVTDFCLRQVIEKSDQLREPSRHIVSDGAYAKKKFTDGIVRQTDLHLISKLRKDEYPRYLDNGLRKPGKGRPETSDGKVDCKNIDKSRSVLCYEDDEIAIYSAIVNSQTLRRNIRAAYVENRKTGGSRVLQSGTGHAAVDTFTSFL